MRVAEKMVLDKNTRARVDKWLSGAYDEAVKAEIRRLLEENPGALIDAFYTDLSFGTGGMRGIMGLGPNRMNDYTVKAATQGLAFTLHKEPSPPNGHAVLIGYDSRKNSTHYAEEAAKVLAGNGIRVFLSRELRPTPWVSFGCRLKRCSAAIMITASHNPPEYNGYKIYWKEGGQVLPPHDKAIMEEIAKIESPSMVQATPSLSHPLIQKVDKEIDEPYLLEIERLQNYPQENHTQGKDLKIVYTSLHGTGITLAPKAFESWGFSNITYVDEQITPDGSFPAAPIPNPEEKKALELGIKKLEATQGDLLIAMDPDADRVGVAVRHQGKVHILTGNQIAALCADHLCLALTQQHKMPPRAAFIKSIVTTELFARITAYYGASCFNVLPGFKYIAEKIDSWEESREGYHFLFGAEESYGYLLGTYARDKDALISANLLCEAALKAKREGLTLIDRLHALYKQYGFYFEKVVSVKFKESKEGREEMAKMMTTLRAHPIESFQGVPVESTEDFLHSIKKNSKGEKSPLLLPRSDVLLFWLTDGSKLIVRPSGTEPKVKIYIGLIQKDFASLEKAEALCEERCDRLLKILRS